MNAAPPLVEERDQPPSPPRQKLPEGAGYLKLSIFKPMRKDYLVRSLKIIIGRGNEDTDKFCAVVITMRER